MIPYISSEAIVDDVKNRMSRYFTSGKVDESILPRVIRKCVGQMGLRIYPEKRAVLELSNYRAALPEGFKSLVVAMLCHGRSVYVKNDTKSRHDQLVCEVPCQTLCSTLCAQTDIDAYGKHCAMTDDCGNLLRLVQTTEYDRFETSEFTILRAAGMSKDLCANDCLNLRSKNKYEFEIKEGPRGPVLQANICDGKIYIEYLSDIEHEDHFEIPDKESVKDWIFEECRKEIYTYLWDNGEDVMQRMQHSERECAIKQERARMVYSQRGVQERYDTANRLVNRFKAMERWLSPQNWCYTRR